MERVPLLAGERQKGESYKAVAACNAYLRLGPRRSLRQLTSGHKRPQMATDSWPLKSLGRWSSKYEWQARAEAYDAQLEQERNERAQEIMASGLALVHERVLELGEPEPLLRGAL